MLYGKQLVMRGDERVDELPFGLEVSGHFRRKGLTNPAIIPYRGELLILARLIYEDEEGNNSAILRYRSRMSDDGIVEVLENTEQAVFPPGGKFASRGAEDLRISKVEGEDVFHAFLVDHDGFNARTRYVRTGKKHRAFLDWEEHGVWFPNIYVEEAIKLVPDKKYKERWEEVHGKKAIEERIRKGLPVPDEVWLPAKDCSLWYSKLPRNGKPHYGLIPRIFPEIQIFYFKDAPELARHEYWQDGVRNINEHELLKRKYPFEESHVGLAGQPVRLNAKILSELGNPFGLKEEAGLMLHHGAVMDPKRRYSMGASLVDPRNPDPKRPLKVVARTPKPVLEATEPWEFEQGVIEHEGVVFPTYHYLTPDGMNLGTFYGASDMHIGHNMQPLKKIIDGMEPVLE